LSCTDESGDAAGESFIDDVLISKETILKKVKPRRQPPISIGVIDSQQTSIVLMNALLFNLQVLPSGPVPIVSINADYIVELETSVV
jgi:hypothetical protein